MIKAAIAGGTGYTAGELLRILVNHPEVEITSVISSSSVGEPVWSVHKDLLGESEICFTDSPGDADVVFLCLGHGLSREFMSKTTLKEGCKVIDLGNDFRLDEKFDSKNFVYGLCELNKKEIEGAENIANPGCFATAIQLGILPLLSNKVELEDIHITALTGSTGAGKKPSETTHFSYRDSNISIYKLFSHQHLGEINKTFNGLGANPKIHIVPVRGDFARGIFASIYTKTDISQEEALKIYNDFYADSPFVFVSKSEISLKDVVNTNKCLLQVQKVGEILHITSVIDNLIKGASGQAVQNMNLMFGLKEDMGLRLKGSAF